MPVKLTAQRAKKVKALCTDILARDRLTIRKLAELICQMAASDPGVPYAPRFYKHLHIEKDKTLRDVDASVLITNRGK